MKYLFAADFILSHLLFLVAFPLMRLFYVQRPIHNEHGRLFAKVCWISTISMWFLVLLLIISPGWVSFLFLALFYVLGCGFCTMLLDRLTEARRLAGVWMIVSALLFLVSAVVGAEELLADRLHLAGSREQVLFAPLVLLLSITVMFKRSYVVVYGNEMQSRRESPIENPYRGWARKSWWVPFGLAVYWMVWIAVLWVKSY